MSGGGSDILLVGAASCIAAFMAFMTIYSLLFSRDYEAALAEFAFMAANAAVAFAAYRRAKQKREEEKNRPMDRRPHDWKGDTMA